MSRRPTRQHQDAIQVGGADITSSATTNELTIALTWFILMFGVLEFVPEKKAENQDGGGHDKGSKSDKREDSHGKRREQVGASGHGKKEPSVEQQRQESIIPPVVDPSSKTVDARSQSVPAPNDELYLAIGRIEAAQRKLGDGGFYAETIMPASERQVVNATLANLGECLQDLRGGKDTTRRIRERMSWLHDNAKSIYDALIQDAAIKRVVSE